MNRMNGMELAGDGRNLGSAIKQLKGRVLSSVEFVHDNLPLRFDGPCLTQIGLAVASAWATESEVAVRFVSGTVISIPMKAENFKGPEAVPFASEDGGCWVG